MAAHLAGRGPRLAALLHRFGISAIELAHQEPKATVALLRSRYYQLAKESHPDRAPMARKVEANETFTRLNEDFEEAVKLLEGGVLPLAARGDSTGAGSQATQKYRPEMYQTRVWTPTPKMEFDLKTRVKGHLVFWSGLFVFLSLLREFLVYSAGHGFAYRPPADYNVFWIRRFSNTWSLEEQKHRETKQAEEVDKKVKAKAVAVEIPKERRVDDFYLKRGISNSRKRYSPRGSGGNHL
mmetsp:Transcript_56097/g.121345  ORF Transcript_56097/g.121345 Transcript_56097/m.121345 type:complete len:239 (+) Transcript_56097:71-787(+)